MERLDVRALARQWIQERAATAQVQGRSVQVETGRLSIFLRLYGDHRPDDLDRRALLAWQAAIGHLAPATRRAYVGTVGRFCRWLQAEGYVVTDLTVHLLKVREPRRSPRALPAADVARALAAAPDLGGRYRTAIWLRPCMLLMVECGLRCIEVSRLNLDDFDREAGTLFVRGKADHERMLPVPSEALDALKGYLRWRGSTAGPLFLRVGSRGRADGRLSAKWISKRVARLMSSAGVHQPGDRRTAHAFRHTAATAVLDRGHDVRLVQGMLGQSSLQSTQIYLPRADLARLRVAMESRPYLARTGNRDPTMLPSPPLGGAGSRGAASPQAPDSTEGDPGYSAIA